MRKVKAVGVYTNDGFTPVAVFTSKMKAKQWAIDNSFVGGGEHKSLYCEYFYYMTPAEVEALPYTQCAQFELAMRSAMDDFERRNK